MRIRTGAGYLAQYIALGVVLGLFLPGAPHAQNSARQSDKETVIRVARVLNVRSGAYLKNAAIWIEGERIRQWVRRSMS
jgi:hypothetical protein